MLGAAVLLTTTTTVFIVARRHPSLLSLSSSLSTPLPTMVTSPTFLPTRRELFLVLSLLVILLFVSQSDYISSNSSSSLSRSLSSQSSLVLDHPKQYGLENGTYPDHRMTWKEEDALPETRLIQHAPGESLQLSHSTWTWQLTRLYRRLERV